MNPLKKALSMFAWPIGKVFKASQKHDVVEKQFIRKISACHDNVLESEGFAPLSGLFEFEVEFWVGGESVERFNFNQGE